jgi:hypothetical protein
MNLEINQATLKTVKAFKALYLAASICGALIIGTVAVTAVSNPSDSNVVSRDMTSSQSTTYLGPTEPTAAELATTYFLVDSEAQRTAVFVEVERGELVIPLNQAGEPNFVVLLAGTPEDEASALSVLAGKESRLMAANAEMKVIDLRTP